MPQPITYPLKAAPDGSETLLIQETAGGAGSVKRTTVDAVAAKKLGWISIMDKAFGAIPDGPVPSFTFGTPSTAGATINTGAVIAAAAAAAGGVLYIPAIAAGSFVVDGTIPLYGDTQVKFGGPGARLVLADGSKLGGREPVAATTVAAGSNGISTSTFINDFDVDATGVLNVASTAGFASAGEITLTQGATVIGLGYTGKTATSFTGVRRYTTGAYGAANVTMATGNVVASVPSIDVGIFELATPHERRVMIDGWGRIFGTKNRQLGHSSGTTWTLKAITGTDITESASSLAFGWNETIAANLFPTPPFPIRVGTPPVGLPTPAVCEVMIVESINAAAKTGTILAGTRGSRETAAVIHAVGEAIKVEYSHVFFDMSTNAETKANGQLEDHGVRDLWLYQASGNGVHTIGLGRDGVGRMHHGVMKNLLGHQVDGNVLRQQSADGQIDTVISSLSGRQSICLLGANQHGHHNKGFNSGRLSTDLGIGLDVQGPRNSDLSFEGQDNDWAAARVASANNEITIVGDSNGRATGFDGTSVILDGISHQCKNNTLKVKSFTRGGTFIRQAYSVTIVNDAGGGSDVDDNTIEMNNRLLTKGDISGDPIGNRIWGDGRNGQRSIAYAASITPHPDLAETHIVGALAGGCTLNIPTNNCLDPSINIGLGAGFGPCYRDQIIEMIFQQGTGGDVVNVSAYIVTNPAWMPAGAGLRGVFRAKCISANGLTWLQI